MGSPFTMRKRMVEIGQAMHRQGWLAGTDGSLSVRLDDDRIMISPVGAAVGAMAPDDLLIVDINGKRLQGSGEATPETSVHLAAYQNRADVKSCILSHAPYSTAFAVAGVELGRDIMPEVVLAVGPIPLTDYAPPGTGAVAKALAPHWENGNAFLLRNRGLVTVGRSLEEAFYRHETVEHFARIVHLARQLGQVEGIPSDDFERLERLRRKLDEAWDQKS